VWLAVVFATTLCDGLKALGLLGEGWAFASGNYRLVGQATARYGTPGWLNGLLFVGVVCWEGATALLFCLAGLRWGRREGHGLRHAAFATGLGLWAAFLLADEAFVAYALEGTHLRLFTAQLATLLAVELLPGGGRPAGRD
jgi:hypothetical protein